MPTSLPGWRIPGATQTPWIDTRYYSSLDAAVAAATSAGTGLVISNSITLDGNKTFSIPITIPYGGMLVKASTYTVTFNGAFEAGLYQVLSGFSSGDITFGDGSVKEIYPEWWGIDGTADNTEVQLAIDSAKNSITDSWASGNATRPHGAIPVRLTNRSYNFTGGITIYGGMSLLGIGMESTLINFTGSSTNVITIAKENPGDTPVLHLVGLHLADFAINGGGKTNVGIFTSNSGEMENALIERISIDNVQVGVRIESGWLNTVRNVFVSNAIVGFAAMPTSASFGVNQNYFIDCRADRFTRHGFFVSGVANKVMNCTCQFDAYVGTDAAPSNIASHAFPVGIEIYGKDATTLGIQVSAPVNNEVLGCWLESIADSGNGVGIYLDGVDTVFGYIGPQVTKIEGCYANNNVDRFIYINAGAYTHIGKNYTKGFAYVILNPPSTTLTQFTNTGFLGYIQNPSGTDLSPAAGSYSMLWQTGSQGDKVLIKGKIGFDTQADFVNADTILYGSSTGTAPHINNTYLSLSELHGYFTDVQSFSQSVSIISGAARTITGAIPSGVLLLGVTLLVTEEITGAAGFTGFDIGDGTTQNLWGDNISPTLGTSATTTGYAATWVGPRFYLTGNNIVLTARGANFDGTTGIIRYVAHCVTLGAPTQYN